MKTISRKQVACQIPCWLGRKRINKSLAELGHANGGDWCLPRAFRCKQCGAEWSTEDFSGGEQPENVTCSSCYGNRVYIVGAQVERVNWSRIGEEQQRARRAE